MMYVFHPAFLPSIHPSSSNRTSLGEKSISCLLILDYPDYLRGDQIPRLTSALGSVLNPIIWKRLEIFCVSRSSCQVSYFRPISIQPENHLSLFTDCKRPISRFPFEQRGICVLVKKKKGLITNVIVFRFHNSATSHNISFLTPKTSTLSLPSVLWHTD